MTGLPHEPEPIAGVLVTGGTGHLGRRMLRRLSQPTVLTRDPARAAALLGDGVRCVEWAGDSRPLPDGALRGVRAVLHLAGEPIAMGGPWSGEKKARIRSSRIDSTRALVDAIAALPAEERPGVLVCASAAGLYGERGDEELPEEAAPSGQSFWAQVVRDWEQEAMRAEALGVRVVCVRMGIVIGREGGFLAKTIRTFRAGLGGPIGTGVMWMPWISEDDLLGVLGRALVDDALRGPVNAAAPQPVRNCEFTRTLASTVRRPAWLPLPRALYRAALGEVADALLVSQRVVPRKLMALGHRFEHPTLADALAEATRTA